jgi:hypothetical protein
VIFKPEKASENWLQKIIRIEYLCVLYLT